MSWGRYSKGNPALGLFILRLVLGTTLFLLGLAKITGQFGGPGLDALTAGFAEQGLEPARLLAGLSAALDMLAGLLLFIGLFTTEAALAVIVLMLVAVFREHLFTQIPADPRVWGEIVIAARWQLTALAAALALALTGPGAISLDSGRFKEFTFKGD